MSSLSKRIPFVLFTLSLLIQGSLAQAAATHLGKVSLELSKVEGKDLKLVTKKNAEFHLDWSTGKCELQIENEYAYCLLDVKDTLKDKAGKEKVRAMPKAHFDEKALKGLFLLLASDDQALRASIESSFSKASEVKAFLDIPFYACESAVNESCILKNAFQGQVGAMTELKNTSGQYRMTLTLSKLKPVKDAFLGPGSRH